MVVATVCVLLVRAVLGAERGSGLRSPGDSGPANDRPQCHPVATHFAVRWRAAPHSRRAPRLPLGTHHTPLRPLQTRWVPSPLCTLTARHARIYVCTILLPRHSIQQTQFILSFKNVALILSSRLLLNFTSEIHYIYSSSTKCLPSLFVVTNKKWSISLEKSHLEYVITP